MIDITINITDYITIEQITNEFNKINNKREEYTLNLVLYKFVQPETLAVIVSLYKYKISEEYTISIIIKNSNSYAERLDFYKHLNKETVVNNYRYSSEGRFVEITNFDNTNSIELVNEVMKIFRNNLELEESVFKMLNYCFFEVVDNVQNHADSNIGGFLVAQRYPTGRKLCISIIDCGKGIYRSLTENDKSEYSNLTEEEAISYCIRESVTNGKGMGNGLYHTTRFIELNDGKLMIYSGNKKLIIENNEKEIRDIPYFNGTIVSLQIEMDNEVRLEDIFGENIPVSVDEAEDMVFDLW
ncbi:MULTISPECIES: ATP-binding protein [Clostridium]|jgi:hypothetical protein|uniref:ATPase/histidine kinase/DNA gyrase B/HSP90 domain protein n=1 Tax=Clostridium celatum DSM 1785 TaxID=545697 RepID=L1QJ65_9CLOT|nr:MULTISPECIES: ATP-binding protein [Clostridium]EKY28059.1 hypothetical protein HMPREF0216_00901 [Clostridium celatum DSM 1785]MCE9654178.1 ATP-binding protein [Clostridium celatum]MDU2265272.1 ATP-binding protein [Clostridium celatum]MDU6295998.1 ATP-binding protein [Clostridium celatum]